MTAGALSGYGLAVLLTAMLTGGVLWLLFRRRIRQLEHENARLTGELEMGARLQQESEQLRKQLADQFATLSGEALDRNNRRFLQLAEQNLKQYQEGARADLAKRGEAIEHMVKPIREQLEKTEKQIRQIEKERQEAFGSLNQQLQAMAETQTNLRAETMNLVQALRRPEVRGQWGELTLRRVVELAGMVEHCDFHEQETARDGDSTSRPDMIVRMPESREIVVDAKTPLDAYITAVQTADPEIRAREMQRFARHMRDKVKELAGKDYWARFKNSPEFVVLFIPGEQFLGAALEIHPELQEEALQQKVILATPNNLVALLKTIAFGWRQQALAENAEHLRQEGTRLYDRIVTFTEHLGKVGRSLRQSVDHYNRAVGSLERQLLPSARRFPEMGIQPRKTLGDIEQIDVTTRSLPDIQDESEESVNDESGKDQ